MWYNYEPLGDPAKHKKDWTDDCVMRLMGNSRLRQLRVREGKCGISSYVKNTSMDCAPSWRRGSQDKDTYSLSWITKKNASTRYTPWGYVPRSRSNSSVFYGESSTLYPSGGYIVSLGFYKRETRTTLLTLEKTSWLDHRTRVVFVELTLYNVNTDLFTQVVLVTEQNPTGEYITIPKVESISTDIRFNFWNICFIGIQIFFFVRMLYFMNRNGIVVYLSSSMNKLDTFLLLLGFATAILYIIHIKSSLNYIEDFNRRGHDQFFSFFEIIRYSQMSERVLYFLFLTTVVKLLFSWRFGTIYFAFYNALLLSRAWIACLTFCYIVCLAIAWRLVGYTLNVFIFSHWSSFIIYFKDFKVTGGGKGILANIIVYLMCLMSAFVINIFIASFWHFYKIGRCYIPISTAQLELNYISFAKDEFVHLTGGKKKPMREIEEPKQEKKPKHEIKVSNRKIDK